MDNKNILENDLKEMPNYWSGNFFGFSPKNRYGLQLKVYLFDKGCFTYTTIPDHFCGFDGIVHGGILAAIMDEIAAWTLKVYLKKVCLTQEVKVKFYKPVQANTPVIVEGKVKELGEFEVKTITYIKNTDGIILAECENSWKISDFQTLAKITGKDVTSIKEMYRSFIKPIEFFKQKRNLS
ncbi:MAG: PaaI family thioesterase [Promethearchaeota archaeon]